MRNRSEATFISGLLESARYEILPTKSIANDVINHVPLGRTITVTASVSLGLSATLDVAETLQGMGYRAVPHLAARMVHDRTQLEEISSRLAGAGIEVADGTAVAHGAGPTGTEVFEVPLPAVIAVQEGGVEPRYPSIPGRMKAKRAPLETLTPKRDPAGSGRVRLTLPPEQPSSVQVLGQGPEAAPALVDILTEMGVISR